jgi:hypothetical protein
LNLGADLCMFEPEDPGMVMAIPAQELIRISSFFITK